MRAAQIGGDGVLRDASGFAYADGYSRKTRPAQQPARPFPKRAPFAPKLMSNSVSKTIPRRPSGGIFGLGQAVEKTNPQLREMAENPVVTADGKRKYGYPAPLPVSGFVITKGLTGDFKKQVYSGRFVFPSNIDAATAAAANVDPSGVYMVSAQPFVSGTIRLMKIIEATGRWADVPLVVFNKYFFAVSIDTQLDIESLIPIYGPLFGVSTKPDPIRASVGWVKSMYDNAYSFIAESSLTSADINSADRETKVEDLKMSIYTAGMLVGDGIRSAGAGFDTRYLGWQAYLSLSAAGRDMLEYLKYLLKHVDAVQTSKSDAAYSNLVVACARVLTRGALWGSLTIRALIWVSLRNASVIPLRDLRWAAITSSQEFINKANNQEVATKAGVSVGDVENYKKMLASYYEDILTVESEEDKALEAYFAETGLTQEDWIEAYPYLVDTLSENTRTIAILKRQSIAPILDPSVYKGLAGLGNFAALGNGKIRRPVQLEKLKPAIKGEAKAKEERYREMKPEDREAADRLMTEAYAQADALFQIHMKESASAFRELMEVAEKKPALMQEFTEDPEVLKKHGRDYIAKGTAENDPAKLQLGESLVRAATEGTGAFIKGYQSAAKRYTEIENRRQANPNRAAYDLFTLALTAKGNFSVTDVDFKAFTERYARFLRAYKMDNVLGVEVYRSSLYNEFGPVKGALVVEEGMKHLTEEIALLNDKIANGEIVNGQRRPISDDAKKAATEKIAAFTRLKRLVAVSQDYGRYEAKIWEVVTSAMSEGKDIAKEQTLLIGIGLSVNADLRMADDIRKGSEDIVKNKLFEVEQGAELDADIKRFGVLEKLLVEAKTKLSFYSGDPNTLDYQNKIALAYKEVRDIHNQFREVYGEYAKVKARLEVFIKMNESKARRWKLAKGILYWGTIGGYTGPRRIAEIAFGKEHKISRFFFMGTVGAVMWSMYAVYNMSVLWLITKILGALGFHTLEVAFRKVWKNTLGRLTATDPPNGVSDPGLPEEKDEDVLSTWQVLGLGTVAAAIFAPKIVIPGVIRLVNTVIGGIGSIARGGKGRGRPALGKKPGAGAGAGAPPDMNKAIEEIKKGREVGNPFLVKKGMDKLRRAKQMGLPVPKGYIDGLSWGF